MQPGHKAEDCWNKKSVNAVEGEQEPEVEQLGGFEMAMLEDPAEFEGLECPCCMGHESYVDLCPLYCKEPECVNALDTLKGEWERLANRGL